jgi:glycosyltransferase involved in cell wall biosynthesis
MRVLLVVHRFLPHLAGTELYTLGLARQLARRHTVLIYYRDQRQQTKGLQSWDGTIEGLPVHCVSLNLTGLRRNRYRMFISSYLNPEIERDFAGVLRRFQPEVVHFQHLMYLSARLPVIARQHGIPTVLTLHDYWFKCNNSTLLRYTGEVCYDNEQFYACADCASQRRRSEPMRSLMALVLRSRDAVLRQVLHQVQSIIAPSRFLKCQFVRDGYVPEEKVCVVENGIETPASLPPRDGLARDTMRFVYIGSIAPHKGIHVAIQAFNELAVSNRARLDIYGDLEAEPQYVARLRNMIGHPNIRLCGPLARENLWRVLSESDILILPSLWYENSPIVIQEAFVAGVPVIASAIGALPEKVCHGINGMLFPPGDVHALRSLLHTIVNDPEIAVCLRRGIPRVVQLEENADQIEQIYYEALCSEGK